MRNDWSISYMAEYISGLDADTFCNCGTGNQPDGTYIQKIDSYLYHDLVASYDFDTWGSNTQISAGLTNLTNEEPPFIEVGFNATTEPAAYRMFGRGWYLRLKWSY
jgi:iron complex outermembrane receptor protein